MDVPILTVSVPLNGIDFEEVFGDYNRDQYEFHFRAKSVRDSVLNEVQHNNVERRDDALIEYANIAFTLAQMPPAHARCQYQFSSLVCVFPSVQAVVHTDTSLNTEAVIASTSAAAVFSGRSQHEEAYRTLRRVTPMVRQFCPRVFATPCIDDMVGNGTGLSYVLERNGSAFLDRVLDRHRDTYVMSSTLHNAVLRMLASRVLLHRSKQEPVDTEESVLEQLHLVCSAYDEARAAAQAMPTIPELAHVAAHMNVLSMHRFGEYCKSMKMYGGHVKSAELAHEAAQRMIGDKAATIRDKMNLLRGSARDYRSIVDSMSPVPPRVTFTWASPEEIAASDKAVTIDVKTGVVSGLKRKYAYESPKSV